jgi:hypothetical protein
LSEYGYLRLIGVLGILLLARLALRVVLPVLRLLEEPMTGHRPDRYRLYAERRHERTVSNTAAFGGGKSERQDAA